MNCQMVTEEVDTVGIECGKPAQGLIYASTPNFKIALHFCKEHIQEYLVKFPLTGAPK